MPNLLYHLPTLNTLAAGWLERGARRVTLLDRCGNVLEAWNGPHQPNVVRFAAAVDDDTFWCVETAAGPATKARFDTESYLLARLAHTEDELSALTTELVSAQDRLVALFKLNQMPHASGTLQELVSRLAEATHAITGAEGVAISLKGHPPVVTGSLTPSDDAIAFLVERYGGTGTTLTNAVDHSTVHSLLLVPIMPGEGWLCLLDGQAEAFHASDRKLAEAIASQTGTFLENHHLHAAQLQTTRIQTEMALARDVQLALVPTAAPTCPGLDVFATTRPASVVGGDFFNFAQPDAQHLNLVLADLTGKGMSAAMLMTMTRVTLQAGWAAYPNATPADVAGFANRVLYEDFTRVGVFATLFYGAYEVRTRTLAYTNAGQSPVVVCPAGEPARLLEADDIPLGVMAGGSYSTQTLTLGPDDILLIGTDGLTEAWQGNTIFGYQRLLDVVSLHRQLPAKGIAEAVIDAVMHFSNGRQNDDQTLIVLKGEPHA
jgi:sigma-B regulation protein RsbU (phosphoserine phosphatase)